MNKRYFDFGFGISDLSGGADILVCPGEPSARSIGGPDTLVGQKNRAAGVPRPPKKASHSFAPALVRQAFLSVDFNEQTGMSILPFQGNPQSQFRFYDTFPYLPLRAS
jgi:hypothetical protein